MVLGQRGVSGSKVPERLPNIFYTVLNGRLERKEETTRVSLPAWEQLSYAKIPSLETKDGIQCK
jgi:hypothetical protein